MTQPSDQNDFTQPAPSNKPNNSTVWILVAAGVGCGCLVLPIVIGIIAAIALPSFLNQASKAKQAEAKQYVGSMMRAEQATYLDKEAFANSIAELNLGIKPETLNYRYQVSPQLGKTKSVMITASSKQPTLKSYTGAVFAIPKGKNSPTVTALCETDRATPTPPTMPAAPKDELSPIECPPGSHLLK